MEPLLEEFEWVGDAVEKIDNLVEQAGKTRGKKEKRKLLEQAQALADAFQRYCEAGGNTVKQFKRIL